MESSILCSNQEFAGIFFIKGVASGTVEAEPRFQWLESEQEVREETQAERILLKSLPLKG